MRKQQKEKQQKEKEKHLLSGSNFHYHTEVEYKREYDCESAGCDNEGICRCSTIYDAHVTEVRIAGIREEIFKKIGKNKLSETEKYCIDRILMSHKIYQADLWEVEADYGYYGQEIGSVTFDDRKAIECDEHIFKMLSLKTDRAKINYVIELEYGYLIASLKDKYYYLVEIEADKIFFAQETHYKKLDQDVVAEYRNYSLPRGVVYEDEGKYRIIDGYHRLAAVGSKYATVYLAKNKGKSKKSS